MVVVRFFENINERIELRDDERIFDWTYIIVYFLFLANGNRKLRIFLLAPKEIYHSL